MGKEGPAGTEKLSKALSVFFETAIKIISNNGGDVIKFCGDALLTVFPSEGELISSGDGDDVEVKDSGVSRRSTLYATEESKNVVLKQPLGFALLCNVQLKQWLLYRHIRSRIQ